MRQPLPSPAALAALLAGLAIAGAAFAQGYGDQLDQDGYYRPAPLGGGFGAPSQDTTDGLGRPLYGSGSLSGGKGSGYRPPADQLLGGGDYRYPQDPSLGDPRPYRESDPRACSGLLCD